NTSFGQVLHGAATQAVEIRFRAFKNGVGSCDHRKKDRPPVADGCVIRIQGSAGSNRSVFGSFYGQGSPVIEHDGEGKQVSGVVIQSAVNACQSGTNRCLRLIETGRRVVVRLFV